MAIAPCSNPSKTPLTPPEERATTAGEMAQSLLLTAYDTPYPGAVYLGAHAPPSIPATAASPLSAFLSTSIDLVQVAHDQTASSKTAILSRRSA